METKRFILLDIDYVTENGRPVVRLFGSQRGESDGEPIIALDRSFKPYIYVIPENDLESCINQIYTLDVYDVKKVIKKDIGIKKEFLEVVLHHPQDVPKLREKILDLSEVKDIREHDIPFYRRYLMDKGLVPMSEVEVNGKLKSPKSAPSVFLDVENLCILEIDGEVKQKDGKIPDLKVMSFDIEVRNPRGMPNSDNDEIIMISMASNFGLEKVISTKKSHFKYVETVEDEKTMIKRFSEIINTENPDIILGYSSDNFDLPYINDRAKKLRIPFKISVDGSDIKFLRRGYTSAAVVRGRVHVDLYPIMRRHLTLDRYTLERVYEELFGEEKDDVEGDQIWEYWDSGGEKLDELFEYSLDDAISAYKVGEKMLPINRELTRIIGQPLSDISRMASGQMIEWFLIRRSYEVNEVIPNKPTQYEYSKRRGRTYVGGYVKEPVKGLHENIVQFDFKSLYPSIIISKNISPDTIITSETDEEYYTAPEVPHKFRKSPEGFIPSIIGDLLEERMKIKKLMKETKDPVEERVLDVQQQALKTLANSMYGVYGYARFRWYSRECADAVTAWGRDYIKNTMQEAEKYGFYAIYADTDGFYATYKGDIEK